MKNCYLAAIIVLLFAFSTNNSYAQTQWKGTTSVNWSTPSNWTNGVPTATTDVIIGDGSFTGAFQPAISASAIAKSLTIGGAVASSLSVSSTLTVKGDIHINSNGTLINGSASISLTGNWNNEGSYTAISNNATVIFAGISQLIGGSNLTNFKKLTINKGSTVTLNSDISCTGVSSLLTVNGILDPNEPTTFLANVDSMIVNSNAVLKVKGSTFNNNYVVSKLLILNAGSIVEYASTLTDQTISSNYTYSTLRISGPGKTKSLGANLPALTSTSSTTGYIYVLSGTLDLKNYSANRGTTVAGGALSVSNGATLKIGGTNGFPANYKSNSLGLTSRIEYNGSNQAVSARTYGDLVLSSTTGSSIKAMPSTAFTVNGSLISDKGTGSSVSFTAASNITVAGSVNIGASTIFNAGNFSHTVSGDWVNNGTLQPATSTITMKGANRSITGSGLQNFYNLTISGPGITATVISNLVISGNLVTSGSGAFLQTSPGILTMNGSSKVMTGKNITLNDLNISGVITSTSTTVVTGNINVDGSLITTSGTFSMEGTGKTLTNSGTLTFRSFKNTGTVNTSSDFTISSSFVNTGTFTSSAGTVTFTGSSNFNGSANFYNITINGSYLRLGANSFLGIANSFIISGGYLNATTYLPNTVNYNGTIAQSITKTTYNNLILSNGNIKKAIDGFAVNNTLTIAPSTTFDAGTYSHTINGNWINEGNFIAGTSTVLFRGKTNTTISGNNSFYKLTLYKTSSSNTLTLLQNVEASIVTMTMGTMKTGNNILTITDTRSGSGIILGTITRNHLFLPDVSYAFESAYSTIKFGSVSGINSVTVKTTLGDVGDFPFGGAISRAYTITIPAGSYSNATLRLHYEDVELNGNDEGNMQLWKFNGSAWAVSGKNSNSSTANYLEKSGLSDITNRWTFTDDGSVLAWNGSLSSDWNTPGNWTLIQGVFSGAPGSTDIVQIGQSPFINQPVISSTVKVKGINFGSNHAVLLSLNAGGNLIVDGTIKGSWTNSVSHLIKSNNYPITINGDLILSDNITGHDINLEMGTGTLTIGGNLIQSGSASIIFGLGGSLRLKQDYVYSGGNFTPGSGVVIYNGTETQTIASVPYNNLTIAKATGSAATTSGSTTISGSLSITSGELDMYDSIIVSKDVIINNSAKLNANSSVLQLGGNWSQGVDSTFDAGFSTVILTGPGNQPISGGIFNNLIIDKPSGITTLSGNIAVNKNLILKSGILNLSTYSINNDGSGNAFTMADNTTLRISGANNFPSNFNIYDLALNSLVNYDGGGVAQTIADVTYGNISFSNGIAFPKEFSTNAVVMGDLVVNSGARVNGKNALITLYGNWINNGGIFIPENCSILLNGTDKTLTGNTIFNDFTVNGKYAVANSNLTFNGRFLVTATGSYDAGTGEATVNGDFINSGYAFSAGTTTFSGTAPQSIRLINALVSTSTGVVNFNGNVSPDFNSTTTPTFATLNINNTAGVKPSVDWLVLIAFNISNGGIFDGGNWRHSIKGSLTNNGIIRSSGILDFNPDEAVNLQLKGNEFSSTGKVIFGGSGKISITGTPNYLEDLKIANSNSSGITLPSSWSINGDFSINSNAIFNAGSFSHVVAGDIESDGVLNGNTSTITMSSPVGQLTGSPETFFNNFQVTGKIFANSDFYVTGDFINNGLYDGSLGAVIMTGSNNAFIRGTTTPSGIAQLTIKKDSGIVVTTNVDINEVTALIVSKGIFFTADRTISQSGTGGALVILDGATLKIGGTRTIPAFGGYGLEKESNVEYAGTTQVISQAGSGYGNLIISTPGNKSATSFLPLTINGDFKILNGNFIANNNTHVLNGDWIMTGGTFNNTNSTISFNGFENQNIQTIAPFNKVTITKYSGSVTMSDDITINSLLSFTKGNIQTGVFKVIIPSGGTVSGSTQSTGWIYGNLQKYVTTGSSVLRSLEIGDSLYYSPATVLFTSVSTAGNIVAKVFPFDNPNADYSGIDTTKSVNRYWKLINSGIAFSDATITFGWSANIMDAGANALNFLAAKFNGSDWALNDVSDRMPTSVKAKGCTTFGEFQVGEPVNQYRWTGNNMTSDWNSNYNWSGGVPTSTGNVLIPSGLSGGKVYPVLNSGTGSAKDITIENAASLVVDNETLRIYGDINNSGTFDVMNGTLEMKGEISQTVAGSMFKNHSIKKLIISNTGPGVSVSTTPNDTLKITGSISFGSSNGVFNTGDNITLVSNNAGTASVGVLAPGNAINGKVIVERYINIGEKPGQHGKSWQLLAVPTVGQTVKESWMENGTAPAGYGIWISSPTGTSAGFDSYSPAPSLKYYDYTKDLWIGVSNTNNPIYSENAYMVFIRGDRSVTGSGQAPKNTVLRTKGNLLTGSVPFEFLPNTYEAVGNPYASVIDFSLIYKNAYVDDAYYVWDPNLVGTYGLGGYQTISSLNGWKPIPGGTTSYPAGIPNSLIQSGQGFFVRSTVYGPPPPDNATIYFTEDCKAVESPAVNFARTAAKSSVTNKSYFRASLFTGPGQNDLIADGNVVVFNQGYRDSVDGMDAIKMINGGENFGLKREGKILSIEARSALSRNDTIYYNISQLKPRQYQLRFAPENMESMNLQAFLVDKFLKTTIPVSLSESSFINISVTADPQSAAANRFEVIFKPSNILLVTYVSISAEAKNKDISVQWNVANEMNVSHYEIERSADGNSFNKTATISVGKNGSKSYSWTDQGLMPGIYYYRIKSFDLDGQLSYSPIAKARVGSIEQSLSIYPNPVVNETIHLHFKNQPTGTYLVRLLNSSGQILMSKIINYNQEKIKEIKVAHKLAGGIYQLEITKPDGTVKVLNVMN